MEHLRQTEKAQAEKPFAARLMVAFMAAFALASMAAIVYQVARGDWFFATRGLFLPLLLAVPWALGKLGFKPGYRLYCVGYAFLLFAFTYGNLLGGFKGSAITDKVSHFLSGFLFTIIGFCIYYKLAVPAHSGRAPLQKHWALAASYALFFSMAVAVVWEVFEFFDFIFTGNDSQNTLTTGVYDTMLDVISALAASLISVAAFVLYRFAKVKLLTAAVVEEFYDANCGGQPLAPDEGAEA